MKTQHLVDTAWLHKHQSDEGLRVFDCTVYINFSPESGLRFESGLPDYREGHIPGAGFLDVIDALSDPSRPQSFALPTPTRFAAAVARQGLTDDATVVVYSGQSYQWATRVWWLLRLHGFDNVSVLDGGLQKWAAEGRPTTTDPCTYPEGTFTPRMRPELVADKDRVMVAIGQPNVRIINALSPEMYSGESPLHFGRKGHIPGSVNLWMRELVDPDANTFLEPSALAAKFRAAGVGQDDQCLTYCGKGVSASADTFGLALIGQESALYDGSMEEWAADPELPMNEGTTP